MRVQNSFVARDKNKLYLQFKWQHTYMHACILLTHKERNLFSRSLTIRFYCHIAIYMTNICTQQISMDPTNIINHNHRISVLKCIFICIHETEDNKTFNKYVDGVVWHKAKCIRKCLRNAEIEIVFCSHVCRMSFCHLLLLFGCFLFGYIFLCCWFFGW